MELLLSILRSKLERKFEVLQFSHKFINNEDSWSFNKNDLTYKFSISYHHRETWYEIRPYVSVCHKEIEDIVYPTSVLDTCATIGAAMPKLHSPYWKEFNLRLYAPAHVDRIFQEIEELYRRFIVPYWQRFNSLDDVLNELIGHEWTGIQSAQRATAIAFYQKDRPLYEMLKHKFTVEYEDGKQSRRDNYAQFIKRIDELWDNT